MVLTTFLSGRFGPLLQRHHYLWVKKATVLGLDGSTLRNGSNGWTCMVGNPRPAPTAAWSSAHEAMPVCTNGVGMKWMNDFMAGKAPQIEWDTCMWMLYGDVGEDNTTPGVLDKADAQDPSKWIDSGLHLTLLPKHLASLDGISDDFDSGAPYVMFSGTPFAHVMIPSEGYYQLQPPD